jgi:DNA-binding protein H-NS
MAKSTVSHAANGAAPVDFSRYSFSELVEIKTDLEREIESRKTKEIDELRTKVSESAHALGISVEELFGMRSRGKGATKHPRGKQPARYRGPNGEEWSGRGPNPRWMKPLLVKGKTKADFLIK